MCESARPFSRKSLNQWLAMLLSAAPSLLDLNLSDNRLGDGEGGGKGVAGAWLGNLTKLKRLDLSGNLLTSLAIGGGEEGGEEAGAFAWVSPSLAELSLSYNRLEEAAELGAVKGRMERVSVLDASYNAISVVDRSIGQTAALFSTEALLALNLTGNPIVL